MRKFYYILQDNPHHPDSLMATSKEEVKSILMESLADESAILGIFTETEFNRKFNSNSGSPQNAIYADPNDFKDGNDFMNSIIRDANKIPNQEPQEIVEENVQQFESPIQQSNNIQSSVSHIFELNGEKIMVKDNKLYKLAWFPINDEAKSDYRIFNQKTNKEVKNENYVIQKLDWIEVENK